MGRGVVYRCRGCVGSPRGAPPPPGMDGNCNRCRRPIRAGTTPVTCLNCRAPFMQPAGRSLGGRRAREPHTVVGPAAVRRRTEWLRKWSGRNPKLAGCLWCAQLPSGGALARSDVQCARRSLIGSAQGSPEGGWWGGGVTAGGSVHSV